MTLSIHERLREQTEEIIRLKAELAKHNDVMKAGRILAEPLKSEMPYLLVQQIFTERFDAFKYYLAAVSKPEGEEETSHEHVCPYPPTRTI